VLEIGVLGPLAVRRDGREVDDLSPMLRRLIALLVARPGSAISVDALAEYLWAGRPPRTARKTIAVYVHRLRKALGDDERITFSANGYAIVVSDDELDLLRFDAVARRAAALSGPEAAQATAEALALWRGEAFQGFRDLEPVAPVADRLVDVRAALLEQRFQAELDLGRADQVVAAIQDAIAENPFRERLRGQLMIALYRTGRQAEALDVFRRTHELLVEELGLEPGPQLQELHQRILAADPALAVVEAARAVPQQLPRDVPDFTGRTADLAWLDETSALTGATAIISAVSGVGGVGKTALAIHWGSAASDKFPDGQLYVNLRGFGPTPPMPAAVALEHLLRGVGVAPESLPADPEQASALLRSRLAGRRVLMVLDNAYSAEQVRPLLPGGTTSFVVVTSRRTLGGLIAREGARLRHLDVLSEPEALQLMAGVLGEERIRAEPEAALELITLCGSLPLALRLASANLADEPSLKLADFVSQVAADRMAALAVPDDPDSAVRAVFAHSRSRLSEREALLFRRIGLLAANDISVWMAAVLIDSTEAAAQATLERLADASLVNRRGSRYQMHDLVHLFAAEDAAAEDIAAVRRAYETLLWLTLEADGRLANRSYPTPAWPAEKPAPEAAFDGAAEKWLDAERSVILSSAYDAAQRGWTDISWQLAAAMTNACGFLTYIADWEQAVYYQLEAEIGDLGNAALLLALGGSLRGRGHAAIAVPYLRRARRIFARDGHIRAAAVAATQLGMARRFLGDRRSAFAAARWAIDRFGVDRSDAQLAWAYISLGNLHMESGRDRIEARAAFERAVAIADATGDRAAHANALGCLAICLRHLEPAAVVLPRLWEANAAFRALGDTMGQSHTDSITAEILLGEGDLVEAQRFALRALEVAQGTHHLQGTCLALNLAGRVALAFGDTDLALERLTAALEVGRTMGGVAATARVLQFLAMAHEAAGQRAQAIAVATEAVELFQKLNHPNAEEISTWLRSLPA
jgi:DNA-binding SARP family transcriptional activator